MLKLHYMAFAKTPKRIRKGVLSICFKNKFKFSRISISAQRHISAWAANCKESNQGLRGNFQQHWPISRPQIWTCFWARRRNNIPQGNCNFLSTKCFINVNRSSGSTDCAAENSKPRVMLRDKRRDPPSKNWENLDFSIDSAWVLAFSSQHHTMWS